MPSSAPLFRELPALMDITAEACRRSFKRFTREAWPYVDPRPFREAWHVDAVADHLQAVGLGQIQLLDVNIPPGHAKSKLISVLWPAWMWTIKPSWQGVFACYIDTLAARDSTHTRALILSPWYQKMFVRDAWSMRPDANTKHDFHNTRHGRRLATSVTGSNTGHRGDCVTTDDPQDAIGAESKAERERTLQWWTQTMSSRLNDPATGARVIVQQRLHEDDLTASVLKSGGYTHLCLPTEYSKRRACVTFTKDKCKFWEDPRTEEKELLFPAMFPREVVDQLKRDMGSRGFEAQYNQNPTPAEGGMFKRSYWRFWKPDGTGIPDAKRPEGCYEGPARALPGNLIELISVDAAFKDGAKNDWVVMTVIGYGCGAERYVIERVRGHFDFNTTVERFRELCARHPMAYKKLIEEAANGTAVINYLAGEISGLVGVKPEGGKESRAAVSQPSVEAGQVFLPDGAGWLDEWCDEFAAFPKGKHDDQVDAFSQAMNHLNASPGMARAIALTTM